MAGKVFLKIVLVQMLLILVGLGAAGLTARYFFSQHHLEQSEIRLSDTLGVLAEEVPLDVPADWCARHARDTRLRLTVISADGKVLCDSDRSVGTMANHSDREEVIEALTSEIGVGRRISGTLNEEMLYVARRIDFGGDEPDKVLRAAVSLRQLKEALRVFDASIALALLFVALLLAGFSVWSGRRLIYGEWSEMEMSIDSIRRDLELKTESLNLEREELSTLMRGISDAVLSVDVEGRPVFFNSRFELLFGDYDFRKRDARLWELIRDPDIQGAYRTALKEGKVGTVRAIPVKQSISASRRYLSLSVSPLRKATGEVYGAVGIFHDVTDLKAAEQIRIDFVANVSHELRTPLTSIKGYTDTLLQDARDGRTIAPEFLKKVSRNVERLMGLINDLLDLSLLESTDVLEKTKVSTEEITDRVIQQLKGAFEQKKQQVNVRFDASYVHADARRLEQVLTNLLDNARKYTPEAGKISVVWTLESADAGDVLLKVSDTGPGIASEHHARLFERFYRVDKARSRELGGTGLGLAIVKHIMQRHEGSIWVESELGKGATFICKFPRA